MRLIKITRFTSLLFYVTIDFFLLYLPELFLMIFDISGKTQDVPDPEVMVAFPILGDSDEASFVAWTTTPWTLPSHLALCVNANFTYLKVCYFHHRLDI